MKVFIEVYFIYLCLYIYFKFVLLCKTALASMHSYHHLHDDMGLILVLFRIHFKEYHF